MPILRVKAEWTGWSGAPGYSVFHFGNFDTGSTAAAQDAADAVSDFFGVVQTLMPVSISVRPLSTVELVDETNGRIMDIYGIVPQPGSAGQYTQGFSAVSGALIHWDTDGVRNGRRVRGKTFLVPLGNALYENNGTIAPAQITMLQTAAQGLIDNPDTALHVYGRPTIAGDDGASYAVLSARVPDKAVILRSRRD